MDPRTSCPPYHIAALIKACAETTKNKGFDVTQVGTQVALFTTEIGEALELVTPTGDQVTDAFIASIREASENYEAYRKHAKEHQDHSEIIDVYPFLEELADIAIRIFSFVGGNGYDDTFIYALVEKMAYNATRPEKHGKGF